MTQVRAASGSAHAHAAIAGGRSSNRLFIDCALILAAFCGMWWVAVAYAEGPARVWVAGGGLIGFCVLAYSLWSAMRRMTGSFERPLAAIRKIVAGDLTARFDIEGDGELAELMTALNTLNERMQRLVNDVRERSKTVVATSAQVGRDSEALRIRTEMQLTSLDETATAMAGLNSMVLQNATQAQQADELVDAAAEHARNGGTAMTQVVNTMGSIRESSRKIVDIIALIDSIAFQTNILALNAAVEAARAGDHGRGFAVVASEVRTLARRSATAAKEIKSLIHGSVETVNTGGKLVDQAGKTMSNIVTSVESLTGIIQSIADSSGAQRSGIESVNDKLRELTRINRSNAKMFGETIEASNTMNEHALTLIKSLSGFNLGVREQGTPEEALALLQRGVEYMREHGKQALLDDINKMAKGQFLDRDLYLFVLNVDDYKFIAHANNKTVLNYDSRNTKDPDGKQYMKDAVDIARRDGTGSVEYKANHPLTYEMKRKITYFQRVGDAVVACGAYLD